MRVLLSGGEKTENIVNGIKSKFTTTGDEFVVIKYLDDIMSIFELGDYFDKAIIIEQSITRDRAITDEMEIRQRINKFAKDISKKQHKYNFVFLAQSEDIAQMMYDEILPIIDDSAIVCKKPPYKVTFFTDLIVTEAAELPKEWRFEPELSVPETGGIRVNADDSKQDSFDDMEIPDVASDLPELSTDEIFDDNFSSSYDNNKRVSNDLGIDTGDNFNIDELLDNLDDEQENNNDSGSDDFNNDTFNTENNENGYNDNNNADEVDEFGFKGGNGFNADNFVTVGGFKNTSTNNPFNTDSDQNSSEESAEDSLSGLEDNLQDLDTPFSYDTNPFSDDTNTFSDDTNTFSDDTNTFSDDTNTFSDEDAPFSDEDAPFSDEDAPFSDEDAPFSDEDAPFSDDTNPFSNEDTPFSDDTNTFSDDTNPFSNEDTPFSDDSNFQDTKNGFTLDDETIDTDNIAPIKQSGDLPNYMEDNTADEGYYDEQNNDVQNNNEMQYDNELNNNSYNNKVSLEKYDDNSYNIQEDEDETIDTSGISPIKQSGNMPEYMEDCEDTENMNNRNYNKQNNQGNASYIPGFDDEQSYEQGDFSNQNIMQDNYDMYEDDQAQDDNYSNNFADDMYDDEPQQESQQQINNSNPDGFDDSVYGGEQSGQTNHVNINKEDIPLESTKKKGLGIFNKKKASKKYQNETNVVSNAQPVQSWQQSEEQNDSAKISKSKINVKGIRESLRPFAARGNSIVVTGCGGCGTSTVAYNLANIINQLGYTVLLVDMDTEGRTQSYISRTNYESMEPDGANLMAAVNSSNGINAHESIVKQGFHLLTMGLGTDTAPVGELLHKEKLNRFSNMARSGHNFVVYDIPFNTAVGYLEDITYMADSLVLVADASNWGVTKLMLNVCNITKEDMQDTIFSKAQLVFNRYRNLDKVLGKKVRTCVDIAKVLDMEVQELIGEDPGFHFEDIHIAGIINDDPDFEKSWFETAQYSDTSKGQAIFLQLLEHIVLKK